MFWLSSFLRAMLSSSMLNCHCLDAVCQVDFSGLLFVYLVLKAFVKLTMFDVSGIFQKQIFWVVFLCITSFCCSGWDVVNRISYFMSLDFFFNCVRPCSCTVLRASGRNFFSHRPCSPGSCLIELEAWRVAV